MRRINKSVFLIFDVYRFYFLMESSADNSIFGPLQKTINDAVSSLEKAETTDMATENTFISAQETQENQVIETASDKLNTQLSRLNDNLEALQDSLTRDSSYALGVVLIGVGGVLYVNSIDSLWRTVGIVVAVGGIGIVAK